jgi:hypothetical protein
MTNQRTPTAQAKNSWPIRKPLHCWDKDYINSNPDHSLHFSAKQPPLIKNLSGKQQFHTPL